MVSKVNMYISSLEASEIMRMSVDGRSVESIADDLGLSREVITEVLRNVVIKGQLPGRSGRNSPSYTLTIEDRKKGGVASQETRREQRKVQQQHVCGLIDLSNQSHFAVSVMYWVMRGSTKEFLVTISDELVGSVFLKAFRSMGVPDSSIHFQWRGKPSSWTEEKEIREGWGSIGHMIEFASSGSVKSLRLRVSSCSIKMDNVNIKTSSRGLAQAFIAKAKEALNEK